MMMHPPRLAYYIEASEGGGTDRSYYDELPGLCDWHTGHCSRTRNLLYWASLADPAIGQSQLHAGQDFGAHPLLHDGHLIMCLCDVEASIGDRSNIF